MYGLALDIAEAAKAKGMTGRQVVTSSKYARASLLIAMTELRKVRASSLRRIAAAMGLPDEAVGVWVRRNPQAIAQEPDR